MRLEHLLSGENLNRRFLVLRLFVSNKIEKDEAESNADEVELNQKASPIAQLVRALH